MLGFGRYFLGNKIIFRDLVTFQIIYLSYFDVIFNLAFESSHEYGGLKNNSFDIRPIELVSAIRTPI